MLRSGIIFCVILISWSDTSAQIGGKRSYEFLNIPTSARLSGLGGVNVSLDNVDLNLAYANPALAGDSLTGFLSFNYLSYFADIYAVSVVYQHDLGRLGRWFIGTNHFNYGTIQSYDDTGVALGEFNAAETVIYLGRSHKLNNFVLGATLKFINSSINAYNSNALAMDLGGMFRHPTVDFSAGMVFKNIGFVLNDYTDSDDNQLPFDVQVGISFKPGHMPFRFSFTGYNLYQGDITYNDPNSSINREDPGNFDKVFRHIIVATEVLLTKNVNIRFGYNHLIRQELKLEESAQGAGFSYGLMFRIKAFEFAYSRGGYHAAGSTNNFTITTNTNLFFRNRKN